MSFDPVVNDSSSVHQGVARYNTAVGTVPRRDAHDVGVVVFVRAGHRPRPDEPPLTRRARHPPEKRPARAEGSGAPGRLPRGGGVVRLRQFTFTNERRTTLAEFQTLQPGFMVMQ